MLALLAAAPALHTPQQQCRQLGRRALLATTAAAALPPLPAVADDSDDLVALGTVRIKPGNEAVGATEAGGALYVTVRVIPQNNVGTYVTAGKVPPLATARFASPIALMPPCLGRIERSSASQLTTLEMKPASSASSMESAAKRPHEK